MEVPLNLEYASGSKCVPEQQKGESGISAQSAEMPKQTMDTAANTLDTLNREDLQRRELRTLLSLGLSNADAARFLMGTWGMEEPEAQRVLAQHGYVDGGVSPDLDTGLAELTRLDPQ